jgi:hypothetical protein
MTKTTRGPCPVCDRGPKDTALAVTTDEKGTVAYCHRCGFTRAEHLERRPLEPIRSAPAKSEQPAEWSATAEGIWRRTQPLGGSLGETYLLYRGCILPPADGDLRFLAPTDRHPPTLCARVTNAETNAPQTLHFTRLASDGRGKAGGDCDKLLLSGHRKRGGVVRLWPNEAVTCGLAIAEGIESALAAAHLHTPVWAAIDASNLAQFPVLPGVDALTIFADHDNIGIIAAKACARRWHAAGREVRIRAPRVFGTDAADVAREVASQ